jgi:L-alanine-DL-glutamate epimerase-like enolase superfamily enzyme
MPSSVRTSQKRFRNRTASPFRDAVIEERLDIDPADACVAVPMKPGLGVTVIPEAVERYSRL